MTQIPALPAGFSLPNPLYALTLAQPWPQMFLLPEEPKRLENRMWMPPREQLVPGGWFALHGGRLPKSPKEFDECRDALDWINSNVWGMSADPDEWEYQEDILATCVSGIFALARLGSVTTKRGQPWRTSDRYGWLLSDLIALPTPVQVRGSRDLWEVTGEALAAVAEQLGAKLAETRAPRPVTAPAPAAAPTMPTPAVLRPEGLFCPGVAVTRLPARPESDRMYGLPAGDDWATVICKRGKDGRETYSWCSRLTSETGQGSRQQFETWLALLRDAAFMKSGAA